MNLDQLAEFEQLFGHRHEALALVCMLAGGPMRWTDIGRAMNRRANERIDDKYVTRSVEALEKRGLLHFINREDGSQLRALTPRGVARARRIEHIFASLDEHHLPVAEAEGG